MLVTTWIDGKKFLAFTSCLLTGFLSVSATAFTLGDIRLESALNQPLQARIELLELDGLDESQIRVTLGSEADFERVGVEPLPLLNELDFDVAVYSATRGEILISSPEAIVEPYLNFVLNVRWPSGRVIREYTVLLDLPTFSANPVPAPAPAPAETAPRPAPTPAPVAPRPQIAEQVTPQTLPDSDPEPVSEPTPEPVPVPAPAAEVRQFPEPASNVESVVIQPGDSLWNIALATRPDNGVSVQQMMLAIQRANSGSDAFINNNINGIRAGRVLRIPDRQEIQTITQEQAISQVAIQNQQFGGGQPLAVNNTQGRPANTRDELSIVTDADNLGRDEEVDGLNATIRALETELALSQESLDVARMENEELRTRLADLQEQISILENIIAIEDQRMAELQAQLAEQNQTPAEPAPVAVTQVPPAAPAPAPAPVNESLVSRVSNFLGSTLGMGVTLLVLLALVIGFLVARNRRDGHDDEDFDSLLEEETDNNTATEAYDDSEDQMGAGNQATDFDDDSDVSVAPDVMDDEEDSDEDDSMDEAGYPHDGDDTDSDSDDDEDEDFDSEDDDEEAQEEAEDEPVAKHGFLAGLFSRFSRNKAEDPEEDENGDSDEDEDEDYEDDEEYDDEEEDSYEGDEDDLYEDDATAREETFDDDDDSTLFSADLDEELDEETDAEVDELAEEDSEDDIAFEADETLSEDLESESDTALDLNDLQDTESEDHETEAFSPELEVRDAETGTETDDLSIEFTDLDAEEDAGSGIVTAETTDENNASEASEDDDVFEFKLDDKPTSVQGDSPASDADDLESFEFSLNDTAQAPAQDDNDADADEEVETFDFGDFTLDQTTTDTDRQSEEAATGDDDDIEEISFSIDADEAESDMETPAQEADSGKTGSLGKLGIDDDLLDDDSDEEELEMITDQDEVATKLDLAVAYHAMEDIEGASEILNEVIAEGNEEQIAEAKRLLEEWGAS